MKQILANIVISILFNLFFKIDNKQFKNYNNE
jgi:hypothetical protein